MNIIKSLFLSFLSVSAQTINFISVGDWGGASLGGYHYNNINDLSKTIKNYVQDNDSKFVINTGDNFYYCGIQDVNDTQVNNDYLNLFGNINIDWYNSLGNHDYGYNVDAQIELNKTIPYWILPDRYYNRKINILNETINLIVLDTSPCVSDYRNNDPSKWDPCGTLYPTCSQTSGNDDYEGECKFNENILSQNCLEQYDWFYNQINNLSMNDWNIVVGHHIVNQMDVYNFKDLINRPEVHLYLNGHSHLLSYYEYNNSAKYITTGGGSMVYTRLNKKNLRGNSEINTIWTKTITGFTAHTIEGNKIRTDYIDKNGDIIYTFEITR